MNNYMIIGIVAVASIAVGIVGISTMSQTDMNIPSSQDAEEALSNIQEDIEDIDSGYGQVTQQEGAYSP